MWDRTEKTIFVVAFIFIALFTRDQLWNPNDTSRLGAVESIVERGTFSIDNSTFVNTIDKVKSGGHYYSDKPAMSYLIAVPAYILLYHLLGLNFVEHREYTYFLITWLTVGLAISIMLVYFYRLLKMFNLDEKTRIFYLVSMFLCTLVFPYSLIYSSHGLTTAFLPICLYLVLNAKTKKQFFWTGLVCGFTATLDMVAASIFSALFLVFIWRKKRKRTMFFILGIAIPVIVALLLNLCISGSIIPFNINPQLFNFAGSAFGKDSLSGVVMQSWSKIPGYAFDLTIGIHKGFFVYTPVLLFSLAGLIIALRKKEYRDQAIIVLAGVAATLVFYITRTNNYGGCSYGLRWTVPLIPLIYLFTPLIFVKKNKYIKVVKILFFLTLLVSAFFALLGAMEPWTCTPGLLPKDHIFALIEKVINPEFARKLLL
jgi:hypothetical protein